MRKILLCLSVVGCLASSVAFGQGRPGGAGPPSGPPSGPPMGHPGGSSMGSPHMGGSDMRGEFGSRQDEARRQEAQARSSMRRDEARALRDAKAPEQALFGLSTAERAQLLKDADLATRKAFGTYQAALARAKRSDDSTAVTGEAMTAAELQTFGSDTQARARELKGSDRTTKQAFGTFQASLARQQALERAASSASAKAQFGTETSDGAKLQGKADADSRKAFGAKTASRAKTDNP